MITYLQVENLTKSYGEEVLFQDITFSILKNSKTALIAPNGTGKTSLLNIIVGHDTADSGQVTFKNDLTVGYLQQSPQVDENKTVIEQVFAHSGEVAKAVLEYENAVNSGDQNQITTATQKMDSLQAWDFEAKIKKFLSKLKINDFNAKVSTLSGGQKKRLAITALLIKDPDLLILDEPTNHLDIELIEWLEDYLSKSYCTLLMVTHDRYFLDRICNTIIEIDNNNVYTYNGNYSYFLAKREERHALQNQQASKAESLFKRELEWAKRMPKARTTKAKYRLDKVDELEEKSKQKVKQEELKFCVEMNRMGKKILNLKNIYKSFGEKKIIEDFSYSFVHGDKIGIVGNNGTGKTTFLNILTEQLSPDSGIIDLGQTITFGYYTQKGLDFDKSQKLIDIIQAKAEIISLGDGRKLNASQFLEYFLFPPSMHYNPVEKLSGGELKRLYLMTILMENPNFLILDEPTNDLDIMTLSVLENYLLSFRGCVLTVSHDRYFMDKITDNLFIFEGDGKIKNFVGKYTDYYNYKIEKEASEKAQSTKKQKPSREKRSVAGTKKTYKERLQFEELEKEIPELERKIALIEESLASSNLAYEEITKKAEELSSLKELLDEKEMLWLSLSEKD